MDFTEDDNGLFPHDSPPNFLEAEDAMPVVIGAKPQAAALAGGVPRYTGKFEKWRTLDPKYQVSRILGQGSYGQVAEAVDGSSGKKVAVKRMDHIFDDMTDAKRVYREMHILRQLNHPNIIKIRDVFCPNLDLSNPSIFGFQSDSRTTIKRGRNPGEPPRANELYFVFDFMDTDLYKLILSAQFLTTAHIKTFMYQILVGLKYLHSANVVHRDIKPANILVNEDCSLKICDFGLSRVIGYERPRGSSSADATSALTPDTADTTVVGGEAAVPSENTLPRPLKRELTRHVVTRWYRAPELILLQEYSSAVDIWSAGCIFAELLGMQKESIPDHHGRSALFPGKTCYPLSGDHEKDDGNLFSPERARDRVDQLSVIFDVIGSPSESDIESIYDMDTKRYLRAVETKEATDFKDMYSGADDLAIDLLNHMLRFNPRNRVSVEQALRHRFFEDIRNPELEVTILSPMSFDLENSFETTENLRSSVRHY